MLLKAFLSLVFLGIVVTGSFAKETSKESKLTKEGICAGCQATVKELSRTLKHVTSEPISQRVPVLLSTVCRKENFKTYDITPSVIEETCKLMMKNNRTAIEATLVNYYNAKSRLDHSYLDIVQTICSEVTSFCPGGGGAATEVPKKGGVVYNRETDSFDVIPGENVKMVRPSKQNHEEL
ncbi:uncharacterized protein LOC128166624 [Crassostrea angulata]|uniref:uncharacterized protein LOC128166624 n=1 Tax=Magallana angulata TaxID=2784310 RepID=UPI0022B11024|nr:uncharacterized protein LOC128166624 [Crassostrea angulata]